MAKQLKIGDPIPSFSLENQNGELRCNSGYLGNWLVLYFYPKDNTPGCTTEALDFTQLKQKFSSKNATIVGISPDSPISHQKFVDKKRLSIELLSDSEKKACHAFNVWHPKKLAGREYMGVVRTTFLVDPEGVIRGIWNTVKVKGHADAVLSELCSLL